MFSQNVFGVLVAVSKIYLRLYFCTQTSRKHCYNIKSYRENSFSTFAKFTEKLTFLTPWYAHVRVIALAGGMEREHWSEMG